MGFGWVFARSKALYITRLDNGYQFQTAFRLSAALIRFKAKSCAIHRDK